MRSERADSWPPTPDSPRASSLYHATTTIDDLTLALTNHSRVPSPEPSIPLTCCCGKEDCDNTKGWLALKSKLESRLILSAEVGQALLQRHEAYVRRQESRSGRSRSQETEVDLPIESVDSRVADLVRENAVLDKRLTQALLDNEMIDSSHKAALQELEEARASVSRLAVHHARTVGLDTRLKTVMREKDDIQQERDSEAHKAKLAEARIAGLKERTSKLQTEVRRLQHDLEQRRQHRLELSEDILHDARSRLQTLQNYQPGQTLEQENEVTKVLESLVADNENLKHDNAELQNLLTEAREDVRTLMEEVEEHRAGLPSGSKSDTSHSQKYDTPSIPSSLQEQTMYHPSRRPASLEARSRRAFEPLTPETGKRPLSPVDSLAPPDTKYTSFGQSQPRYSSSHVSFETETDRQQDNPSPSPQRGTPHKSLFLLSQSRGVQTDAWPASGMLAPSPIHHTHSFGDHLSTSSPREGQSESSSMADSNSSPMTIILERVISLLARMTQADALTLTNRLKRQNLKGADVKHLSRATVGGILTDSAQLRSQFRAILEDDKIPTNCSRKDLRGLFKLFKEIFDEMGQMRVTLNDVVLDPSLASMISEMALDPAKFAERERQAAKASSWINPLSKLFGAPSGPIETSASTRDAPAMVRVTSRGRDITRAPAKFVPKLGPALASTTTTVNVEFSSGIGRSITSTSDGRSRRDDGSMRRAVSSNAAAPPASTQGSLMGIFAGAPQPRPSDPWVVLPNAQRIARPSMLSPDMPGTATLGRSAMRNSVRLSQNVDAVIDVDVQSTTASDDEDDGLSPLFQRNNTLRRRGLSDSSIHSTFKSQAEDAPPLMNNEIIPQDEGWPQRASVLRTLSRTVRTFRSAAALVGVASEPDYEPRVTSGVETPIAGSTPPRSKSLARKDPSTSASPARSSPRTTSSMVPRNLSSWGTAGTALSSNTDLGFFVGSSRDDFAGRSYAHETHGRDF